MVTTAATTTVRYDEKLDTEKAREFAEQEGDGSEDDFDMIVANAFEEFRTGDQEWDWPALINEYLWAEPGSEERRWIDLVFVRLCGYSLASVIRTAMARKEGKPDPEL